MREHFNETLADLKDLVDQLFVAGVNHVIYHGTAYSPDDAPWPGWLFYASTQMNPRNSFWRDVPALNAYIARVQSVLQSGRPDNDVLLYWPIYDLWHNPKGLNLNLSVHRREWLEGQSLGPAADRLMEHGYQFDFVSDRQLAGARVRDGRIVMPGGSYRAIVVPACERMPLATLEKLLDLAKSGATVVFEGGPPKTFQDSLNSKRGGRGSSLSSPNSKAAFAQATSKPPLPPPAIDREPMADIAGLEFVRRATDTGRDYFISNRGANAKPLEGWIPLATRAGSVVFMDPMSGRTGVGSLRSAKDGRAEVRVSLQPGESVIVRTITTPKLPGPAWRYWRTAGTGRRHPGHMARDAGPGWT